jgi:drug/metabolite transporter (DMT)-like permease
LSIGTLGIAGTGLAYIWNTNLIQSWGATKASTVTYLIPVVGVLLGIVVLGERLSWNEPVGALLVIAGIALSQGRLPRRRPVAEPVAEHATAPGR